MAKKNETKLALTEEEKARGLNAEEIKGLLINKAILETAKKYDFNEEEKELMIWYQYFFLGRGKPTTHMQFLSSISDDELTRNLPPVFEKIVNSAEELLGDIQHGKE